MSPKLYLVGVFIAAAACSAAITQASAQSDQCRIKGNISVTSGERIYHVPGQRYYNDTVIETHKGERWFCSEQEARAAGWRKSKV